MLVDIYVVLVVVAPSLEHPGLVKYLMLGRDGKYSLISQHVDKLPLRDVVRKLVASHFNVSEGWLSAKLIDIDDTSEPGHISFIYGCMVPEVMQPSSPDAVWVQFQELYEKVCSKDMGRLCGAAQRL